MENKNEIINGLYDLVNIGKEFSASAYGFGAKDAEKLGLDQTAMVLHEKTADKLVKESFSEYGFVKSSVHSLLATHYQKSSDLASKLGLETKAKGLEKLAVEYKTLSEWELPEGPDDTPDKPYHRPDYAAAAA